MKDRRGLPRCGSLWGFLSYFSLKWTYLKRGGRVPKYSPRQETLKCRWGPVTLPLLPERPIVSPRSTSSPFGWRPLTYGSKKTWVLPRGLCISICLQTRNPRSKRLCRALQHWRASQSSPHVDASVPPFELPVEIPASSHKLRNRCRYRQPKEEAA